MNQGRAKERQRDKPAATKIKNRGTMLSLHVAETAHSLEAVPLRTRKLPSAFEGNRPWSACNSYPKYRIKNWPHGPIVEDLQTNDAKPRRSVIREVMCLLSAGTVTFCNEVGTLPQNQPTRRRLSF